MYSLSLLPSSLSVLRSHLCRERAEVDSGKCLIMTQDGNDRVDALRSHHITAKVQRNEPVVMGHRAREAAGGAVPELKEEGGRRNEE